MSASLLDWPAAVEAGPAQAGGKGWQLGRMAKLGLPVPDGLVIVAAASRDRSADGSVPPELLARILEEIHARGWSERALAVRSSAPQEDSARASFAGLHRSCLNVRGAQALAAAIVSVWDSAREPAAVAYRERFGFAADDAAMAVVIMPLLPTVASGVVFTCDPLSGRDDRVLINAHWGLGEALVGGHADVDEYRLQVRRIDDGLELIEQRVGAKRQQSRERADGGTELSETPRELAQRAVLTSEGAVEIAALARDAAAALDFARPRFDVEWVWDGERFWIVQARPVTASARHTYPALSQQPSLWTRGNTKEILPEPLSAMDWSLYAIAADRMLTLGYELGGYRVLPGVAHASLHHGRVYLEASLIQWEGHDAYGIAPAAINALLGGSQGTIAVPTPSWRARAQRGGRLLRYMRRSIKKRRSAAADLAHAREQARAWREQELSQGNRGLAALLRQQVAQVRASDELFFLQGSAGGTLTTLVDLVDKRCPGEGQALTAALMAGGEASVTAQQGYDLIALAQVASEDEAALAWLRSAGRDSAQWSAQLPEGSAFRREFAGFLERYGHRAVAESYLRQPRWREQPDYLLDMVASLVGRHAEVLRQRQREISAPAWQRVSACTPAWLRPLIRHLLRNAIVDCNQREAARSALMAYFEAIRRIAMKLGERLSGDGGFAQADEVFDLSAEELCAVAEGRLGLRHAKARADERRAMRLRWAATAEPEVVVEYGELAAVAATGAAPEAHDADGGFWPGTPIGAGRASGRARIVRDPREAGALEIGDVLIAPSTDPAWTPLFLKAGALVMETGGYLSHGAIVAREFGIPAVANLPGILGALSEGERIEVDGHRGRVRRLSD
ncbi:PEP/pyruvate-binding domain-containing protein [Lysobacter sp. CA196]|uniref:PEP/pyruvate-binding domain-containing protein n=1 Tax=Lysobacter sp. CA196 TaxID=3455606 RepID=UPI003F8D46C8